MPAGEKEDAGQCEDDSDGDDEGDGVRFVVVQALGPDLHGCDEAEAGEDEEGEPE